MEFETN